MSKYLLCIILGIIIYLLWNSKNGFSVGGLNIGDPCSNDDDCAKAKGDTSICKDKCICSNLGTSDEPKNICQLKYADDAAGGAAGGFVRRPLCRDLLKDGKEWADPSNKTCKVYERNPKWCDIRHDARHHCCICNGGENIDVYDIDELEVYMYNNNTKGDIPIHCSKGGGLTPQNIDTYCTRYCSKYPSEPKNCSYTKFNKPYVLKPNLKCKFKASFSQDPIEGNYSEWGYEKIDSLVEVNNTTGVFQKYLDILNTNKANVLRTNMIVDNLSFSEYLLKQYIEKKEGKNIKMISRGIFYCNGKLFYFHIVNAIVRIVIPLYLYEHVKKNPELEHKIMFDFMTENNDNKKVANRYNFLQYNSKVTRATPIVHVDFPVDTLSQRKSGLSLKAYESFMQEYSTKPDLKTRTDIEGEEQENAKMRCINHLNLSESEQIFTNYGDSTEFYTYFAEDLVTFASEKYSNELKLRGDHYLRTLNVGDLPNSFQEMELDFVKNRGIDVFNLWLLLVKPKNEKTLNFFQTEQNNDNMKRLTMIDDEPDKLSTYDRFGAFYPFMSEDYTAYSFKMEEGDAFRFNGNYTPHFGSFPEVSFRLSIDTRYPYLESEFDLEQVFKIDSDNNLVVRTKVDNTTPLIIPPPYLPLVIYKWFQDQFNFIKSIYDDLKEEDRISTTIIEHENNSRFSIEIFQMVLDNVPFEDYKWIPVVQDPRERDPRERKALLQTGWNNNGVIQYLTAAAVSDEE